MRGLEILCGGLLLQFVFTPTTHDVPTLKSPVFPTFQALDGLHLLQYKNFTIEAQEAQHA